MIFDFKILLKTLALQKIPFCSVQVDDTKLILYVPSAYLVSSFTIISKLVLPADIHFRQNGMEFSLGGKLYFGNEIMIDVDLPF